MKNFTKGSEVGPRTAAAFHVLELLKAGVCQKTLPQKEMFTLMV